MQPNNQNQPDAEQPSPLISSVPGMAPPPPAAAPVSPVPPPDAVAVSGPAVATETTEAVGPAAARFDMSTVYPTAPEQHAPPQPAQAADQNQTQPGNTAVSPVAAAQPQQASSPWSARAETITVPMKNVYVVGLAAPFATIGVYVVSYALIVYALAMMLRDNGAGLYGVLANPGVRAFVLAGFLYANIKIVGTYFEDLKIPKPFTSAAFAAMLVFSTILIAVYYANSNLYSFMFSYAPALLGMLLTSFSGLLWYPLSVRWALAPKESAFKRIYPYIAGVIIVAGVGLFLYGLIKSSISLQ